METISADPQAPQATLTAQEEAVRSLLLHIGENPEREGLLKTPARVVKALGEMTSGYKEDAHAILAGALFHEESCDEMVLLRGLKFTSLCEHHMLPFTGEAIVAYIPNGKIVGLSKLARVVHCYARRLQVQERLTRQIADSVFYALDPMGVGVVLRAFHSCMSCRGVGVEGETVTSCLVGALRTDPAARAEFMSLAVR